MTTPRCQHGFRLTAHCPQCEDHIELASISAGFKRGTEPVDNPKHFQGLKKVLLSCVPWPVIWELGVAMLEGALKYGRHNYRVAGQIRASTYFDGTMRHMTSWWEGEDLDPDSGISHIVKAIASNVVLRDAMIRGNFIDDRPPAVDAAFLAGLNARSEALMKKYPKPDPPYTQVDQTWQAAADPAAQQTGQSASLQHDAQENDEGDAV
jgi:hypothetical protein